MDIVYWIKYAVTKYFLNSIKVWINSDLHIGVTKIYSRKQKKLL